MNDIISIEQRKLFFKGKTHKEERGFLYKLNQSASQILVAVMFVMGSIVARFFNIPVKSVMNNYSYDVLVILIVM